MARISSIIQLSFTRLVLFCAEVVDAEVGVGSTEESTMDGFRDSATEDELLFAVVGTAASPSYREEEDDGDQDDEGAEETIVAPAPPASMVEVVDCEAVDDVDAPPLSSSCWRKS